MDARCPTSDCACVANLSVTVVRILLPPTMSSLDGSTHVQTIFLDRLKYTPVVGPPRVPIQVAERIMDMLVGDVETLRSCALTCSEWHPRARYHLLTSILFIGDFHQTRDRLSSLRDYLDANPDMTSRVHRCFLHRKDMGISPQEAWNFLLLRFPALRSLVIACDYMTHSCLHPTTYTRIKAHILLEELVLQVVKFCTSAEFARLLVALPRLKRLECSHVSLTDLEDDEISASTVRRFKNKGQMLSRLEVCQYFRCRRCRCLLGPILSLSDSQDKCQHCARPHQYVPLYA